MKYIYPEYQINLPAGIIQECVDMAPRLLEEIGFSVKNERFLSHLQGKAGIRIEHGRVFFEQDLVKTYIQEFIAKNTQKIESLMKSQKPSAEWKTTTAGYAMMTIDVETEELREATCDDLRDMIKLANSFGIGGEYMIIPQDVPPLMQGLSVHKICYEMSENIMPYEYQRREQLPYVYEMAQVVEKSFPFGFTVPSAMSLDPQELDMFLDIYPTWKKNKASIHFMVHNYTMLGITKPITVPGCAAMCFAENMAVHILFNLFDSEIELPVAINSGNPTDMMNMCWAFGTPQRHLFRFLNSMILPNLGGQMPESYIVKNQVRLETSSAAIDEQAAMEKMAVGLTGAFQGGRTFSYTGTLCVDDIYSGTQFVIDLEIIKYIRETIEAFDPHPDIINTQGLYEELKDICSGEQMIPGHINTAKRFRNIFPSSGLIVREKVNTWLRHRKVLKDRAREVAMDRIKNFEPYHLPDDKQKELDKIYERAQSEFPV